MTSQKSQNKITLLGLMREDLRHRRWMLVLSAFVQLIFGPVATLMTFTDLEAQSYYYYGDDFSRNMQRAMQYAVERMTRSYLPVMMTIIALVGALIVGVGGYRHLFNHRMTDMVNSVPVTRGKQFDSIYYNNWLIWFVPQLVSTILTTIIMLTRATSYGYAPAILSSAFFVMIGSALAFGCMMHLTILAVVLSGTIFNALLNVAFIGFDFIIAYYVFMGLCSSSFSTYSGLPISGSDICWLSAPSSGGYLGALICAGMTGDRYNYAVKSFGSESALWFALIATIIIAIVNLIIAYSMYIKRKSEESESGVSNKPYRMCIRFFNSVLAGLFAALMIEEFFYIDERALAVWQILFAAATCVLVSGLIDMVHTRSAKEFFKNWKQMIVLVVITGAIFSVFEFDLMGYDKQVVSESDIQSAMIESYVYSMGTDGSGYVRDPENEGTIIEKGVLSGYSSTDMFYEIPADIAYRLITSERVLWRRGQAYKYDPRTGRLETLPQYENDWAEYVDIIVDKKSGSDFKRNYRILDRDLMEEIISLPGFMEESFPFRTGALGYPVSIRITDRYMRNEVDIPADKLQELFDATVEDFQDNYSLDYLEMRNCEDNYCLECQYYVIDPRTGEDSYWGYTMNLYVTDRDDRTLALLKELGMEEYRYDPDDTYDDEYYDYY